MWSDLSLGAIAIFHVPLGMPSTAPPSSLQASAGRVPAPPGGGARVGTGAPTGSTQARRGAGRVWKSGAFEGVAHPRKPHRPLRVQVRAGREDRATQPPPHDITGGNDPVPPGIFDQRCTRPLRVIGLARAFREAGSESPCHREPCNFSTCLGRQGKHCVPSSQPPHDARWSTVGRVGPSQAAAHTIAGASPVDRPPPPPPPDCPAVSRNCKSLRRFVRTVVHRVAAIGS